MKLAHIYGTVPVKYDTWQELTKRATKSTPSTKQYLESTGIAVWDNPRWRPKIKDFWWPLRNIGLQHDRAHIKKQMIVSNGVHNHVDRMMGLSLCYVIHNDGFTFTYYKNSKKN